MTSALALRVSNWVKKVAQNLVVLGRKARKNPLLVVLIFLLVALLIFVGSVCVWTIEPFLTRPGAIIVDFVVLWLLLRLLVRALVFPGSIVCWKRSTEQSFKTEIAKQFSHHLCFLYSFLQEVSDEIPERVYTLEKAGQGIGVLDTLVRNFAMQEQDRVNLSEQQQELSQLASFIQVAFKTGHIQFPKERGPVSIHTYLLEKVGSRVQDSLGLTPQDGSRAFSKLKDYIILGDVDLVKRRLSTLISRLKDLQVAVKGNCFKRAQHFFAVPAIGSLHAIRAELSIRYTGQQMWIRGKRATLDSMFIPVRPGAAIDSAPIVVCCNPNAGYYETLVYQSDWIEFYLKRGVSVMVFNYRGYGRSRGRPSPTAVREDGDLIVSHLFSLGCKQVGIHGRSIGGVAACYAASKHPLAFCVADRSFSTLGLTAKYTYGTWAEHGLRVCGTSCDNTQYFNSIASSTVKILIVDPNDAIISDFASLRTAVALAHIEGRPANHTMQFNDVNLQKVADAYTFLTRIFDICDPASSRESRTPSFSPYDPIEERSLAGDDGGPKDWTDLKWLDEHEEAVRSQFPVDIFSLIRDATDFFVNGINAAGTSLQDALSDQSNAGRPVQALRCLMANIQVWGSLPTDNAAAFSGWKSPNGVSHMEVLRFLNGADSIQNLVETEKKLTPDDLASFYLYVARVEVATQKREFRKKADAVARIENQAWLVLLAKDAIREFDDFLTQVYRYFKQRDIRVEGQGSGASDSSEDGSPRHLLQADALVVDEVSRAELGYAIHIDCGHNGALNAQENRQLSFILNPVIRRMIDQGSLDAV